MISLLLGKDGSRYVFLNWSDLSPRLGFLEIRSIVWYFFTTGRGSENARNKYLDSSRPVKERYDGGNWTAKKPLGIVKNRLPREGSEEKSRAQKVEKKRKKERKKGKKIRKNVYIGIQWPRLNCRFSGGLKWRSGQEWENSSKPNPGFCSRTVEPANPLKKYGYILYHFPSCHLTSPPTIYSPFFADARTSFYNVLIFSLFLSFSPLFFFFLQHERIGEL